MFPHSFHSLDYRRKRNCARIFSPSVLTSPFYIPPSPLHPSLFFHTVVKSEHAAGWHCVNRWPHKYFVFTRGLEVQQLHINMHSREIRDGAPHSSAGWLQCRHYKSMNIFPIHQLLACKQTKHVQCQKPTESSSVNETSLSQDSK